MPDIQAVIETSLYVDDLAKAEAFYRDVLGLASLSGWLGRILPSR